MKRLLVVASIFALAVQGPGAMAQAVPTGPTPQFQLSMDLAFALRAKDLTRAVALFTDNGILMSPHEPPAGGRGEITEVLKRLFEGGSLEVHLVSLGSGASDRLGYDIRQFEMTFKPVTGGTKKDKGNYLILLKQGEDGKWRVACGNWNSSLTIRSPAQ